MLSTFDSSFARCRIPFRGHYKALMLHDDVFYVADDGIPAYVCTDAEFAESCCNSYLFFPQKSKQHELAAFLKVFPPEAVFRAI